jgi:isoquinoline 1-oxidoreductase beta subunit
MSVIENVSRRNFLVCVLSAGAFELAARIVPGRAWAQTPVPVARTRADAALLNPSVYLGIEADGTVFIVTHRSEMGTGIRTTLPMIAADELDADWSRVRIEQGVGDERYGDQNTDGSRSIRDFYDGFRRAGASARLMLLNAAAAQLGVPVSQLTTANHEVVHQASNRRIPYGQLVAAAGKMPVPKPEELQFKPKTAWKFVGKQHEIYDQKDILTGKAQFGLDIFRDGMVHAVVERPPVFGGKVRSVDDKAARAVKGVQETVTIEPLTLPYRFQALGGVAVIADNTWAAMQGRKQLKVQWEDGPHAKFESEGYKKELLSTVARAGKVARNVGNVDAEFAKGGKVLEATYYLPMLAHASMEPPAAVAEFRDGKATIWAPQQNPQATQ